MRTLILSDLHLGRPRLAAESADALRPLWKGCDHLIINGDIGEVHHPEHWSRAARQIMRLFDLCEEDNVALTLLSGNHDPFLTDTRHLLLANGLVFVTHGDVVHPAVAPWSVRAERMRQRRAEVLASMPPETRQTLEAHLTASQHASHVDWEHITDQARHSTIPAMLRRPAAILKVLRYWREFPRLLANFMAEHAPSARFAVLGHTHRPGIWRINDRVIINTGSYGFPGRPRAVMIDNVRKLCVHRIQWRGAAYRLNHRAISEFDLL